MMGIRSMAATALCCAILFGNQSHGAASPKKISVRVVVVATFELGNDTGDTPGEFQYWVERLPLPVTLPFDAGRHALRYNPKTHVLGIVVGSGSVNSSASIMALGLDPRFDLSKAYWLLTGIAGINPNTGSVGSAAWAEWVVDRDLAHEIDSREIPADWTTGLVPLTRSRPFQEPPPPAGIFSPSVYHLNPALVDWAYTLTANVPLDDTADLQAIRAKYVDQPEAMRPPHVMKGDEISANNWWVGNLMNKVAEDWMKYWTDGKGVSVTTAMEDHGELNSLQTLAKSRRVDANRVLVLRSASNYSAPYKGQSAAELIASESSSDSATQLSAFIPSLEAAYRAGSPVVAALLAHWDEYAGRMPGASGP